MKTTTKAHTFALIKHGCIYTFPNGGYAICSEFAIAHIGKAPLKITVCVRSTMAKGYTKARRACGGRLLLIGKDYKSLLRGAMDALDAAFGHRKTFYFKITPAKVKAVLNF